MSDPTGKIRNMVDEVAKDYGIVNPGLLDIFEKERAIFWAIPDHDSKLEFLLGMIVALQDRCNKLQAQVNGT